MVARWRIRRLRLLALAKGLRLARLGRREYLARKRTYAYLLQSMRTVRFLVIARAGRLTRIDGRNVLRLAQNPSVEQLYERLQHALAA